MSNLQKEIRKLKRQITVDKIAAVVSSIGAVAGGVVSATQLAAGNELGAVGWGTLSLTNAVNVVKAIRELCDTSDEVKDLEVTGLAPEVVPMLEVINPHNSYVVNKWDATNETIGQTDLGEIDYSL